MKLVWFQGLPKAEQENFKKLLLSSKKVLDKAAEICYNKYESGVVTSQQDYSDPSWAYKQADRNGYLRAYKEMAELFTLSDKD